MCAVLMYAPAALRPPPLSRACGQPEPSAWRASLAANQMEFNLHMASCWFAPMSMVAVHRVLRSGFCRLRDASRRSLGMWAVLLVGLARVNLEREHCGLAAIRSAKCG
jgi:hypothetical protein